MFRANKAAVEGLVIWRIGLIADSGNKSGSWQLKEYRSAGSCASLGRVQDG